MGRKLSILFFGTQMAIGGAQKVLLDQARWFHSHGHSVTAVFYYDKQGLRAAWEANLGIPLLTLTRIDGGGLFMKAYALVTGLWRLWRLLRQRHFDVVESFTYDSNLLALPLAWLAGVPVRIGTHHGIIEGFPRAIERLHTWLVNVGVASVLVSVSNKALEQAEAAGVRRERMLVIQNGIVPPQADASVVDPTRAELGLRSPDLFLLSVGRLVYQKGHEFLIDAMPSILQRYPTAKAVICGDGNRLQSLTAQIRQLGLADSVLLLGNRPDIQRYLNSADIFVLPSRWEGLPVALLEAMGMGLPVVATRVEGVEEVIQDGKQGLLVPPEDSAALAAASLELMGAPETRSQMGTAARRRVEEHYTVDIMCDKYLSLMLRLLASHPNG
jgi:glycosyltransferase involved in cell wall biosynthesis